VTLLLKGSETLADTCYLTVTDHQIGCMEVDGEGANRTAHLLMAVKRARVGRPARDGYPGKDG
jgi:hypothetical protein